MFFYIIVKKHHEVSKQLPFLEGDPSTWLYGTPQDRAQVQVPLVPQQKNTCE